MALADARLTFPRTAAACWMAAAPSLMIVLTTMAFAIFGDWARDKLMN